MMVLEIQIDNVWFEKPMDRNGGKKVPSIATLIWRFVYFIIINERFEFKITELLRAIHNQNYFFMYLVENYYSSNSSFVISSGHAGEPFLSGNIP